MGNHESFSEPVNEYREAYQLPAELPAALSKPFHMVIVGVKPKNKKREV